MKKCPECESENIIKDALLLDRGETSSNHILQIAVDEDPSAYIFKSRHYSDVRAEICAECGYISIYATHPDALWMTYQESKA